MNRICVYLGSSPGGDPAFTDAVAELARECVRRGLGLVYGGGDVGLMGVLADTALAAGGEVIGVIPQGLLAREVGHRGLADLRVVGSMHERKALMADLADAFIAAPGGVGTLEELVEVYTWAQLGIHAKPVGLLDTGGYWGPLEAWLDHAVEQRFLRPEHRAMLLAHPEPAPLLDLLAAWRPSGVTKWLDRPER
ncbi:MAG: hypothetical protein QOE86_1655 [Solirubrobacteraceae bacterium]|jgi:uncharacterized protein (TIGR00730 family)|nr:hypothetical protein [Solirubrobacteraceae bacterium]